MKSKLVASCLVTLGLSVLTAQANHVVGVVSCPNGFTAEGIVLNVTGDTGPFSVLTKSDGTYEIDLGWVKDGQYFYTICVDPSSLPSGITSVTGCQEFTVNSSIATVNFTLYGPRCAPPGTGTPGYWMNHPEAWPVESIEVGGITYWKLGKDGEVGAIDLMKLPVAKDKRWTMFPNLVCAKLNKLIGNDDSCIKDTILAADGWWALYYNDPVRANSAAWADGGPLATILDNYNNGLLPCALHRD